MESKGLNNRKTKIRDKMQVLSHPMLLLVLLLNEDCMGHGRRQGGKEGGLIIQVNGLVLIIQI